MSPVARQPFQLRWIQEFATRIILSCGVLSGENAIFAELAYLSWPTDNAWKMRVGLLGILGTGIVCIMLRALARQSIVSDSHYCFM